MLIKILPNRILLVCLFICCVWHGCQPPPKQAINTSFYHWQTKVDFNKYELNYLQELSVKKLYLKFFDVDWDSQRGMPVPLALIQMDTQKLTPFQIVPTIFITNRTLTHLAAGQTKSLATRIVDKIKVKTSRPIAEIQIDCDWTTSTRNVFFQLLREIKSLMLPEQRLSCTIRLHQLSFPEQTGIPPVDRGMLMCYNVGKVGEWQEENSILTPNVVEQYLEAAPDYPLALDVAFPLFRWGTVFREGVLVHLINDLGAVHLTDTSRFANLSANRFEVVKSTYLDGYYLYQGDRIRIEGVTPETLMKTAKSLGKYLPIPETITWYHLDSSIINRYSHATLRSVQDQLQ